LSEDGEADRDETQTETNIAVPCGGPRFVSAFRLAYGSLNDRLFIGARSTAPEVRLNP